MRGLGPGAAVAAAANVLADREDPLIPLGQDIAFAASLGRRYGTTGRVITALRDGIEPALSEARAQRLLRPNSALAKLHGARFPIAQGPMTRVSDVAPFADAVSRREACRSWRLP